MLTMRSAYLTQPLHDRDLVDLLEDLPAELAERAGAAEADDRAAIDQGIGETGRQVDRRRAGGRHAHAGLLRDAAIGLRRERRRLLVADVDHPDAFVDGISTRSSSIGPPMM